MSENPEKAWIYDAQIAPIKTGIRKMNQRDWQAKPPFKTNLLNLQPAKKHIKDDKTGEIMASLV